MSIRGGSRSRRSTSAASSSATGGLKMLTGESCTSSVTVATPRASRESFRCRNSSGMVFLLIGSWLLPPPAVRLCLTATSPLVGEVAESQRDSAGGGKRLTHVPRLADSLCLHPHG